MKKRPGAAIGDPGTFCFIAMPLTHLRWEEPDDEPVIYTEHMFQFLSGVGAHVNLHKYDLQFMCKS